MLVVPKEPLRGPQEGREPRLRNPEIESRAREVSEQRSFW